jgi:hypothetical protein
MVVKDKAEKDRAALDRPLMDTAGRVGVDSLLAGMAGRAEADSRRVVPDIPVARAADWDRAVALVKTYELLVSVA